MKRNNRLLHYGLTAFLALAMSACQVKRPSTVLSDAQMENVLYDYHIAKALGEGTPHADNYKRVLYVESVFKKYGITQAQFDSSMVWFSRNPEVLGKIYENIVNRLKAEQTNLEELLALREGKPRTSVAGDSVDVWFGQQLYRLTGTPLTNRLTFSLPADSNFQDRDTLRWHVRFLFSGTAFDSVAAPVMSLSLHYKNDSVVSDLRKVCEAGEYSITLQGDTLGALKEVNGFVYYPDRDGRILLLDSISLMRYHCTDTLASAVADTLNTEPGKVVEKSEKEPEQADKAEKLEPEKEVDDAPRMRPKPSSSLSQPQKPLARPRLQKNLEHSEKKLIK